MNCTVVVCPQGCRVPVRLASVPRPVELTFVEPDQVRARVRVAIPLTSIPIEGCSMSVDFRVDTSQGARNFVGLQSTASMRQDEHAERSGYTRLDIDDFDEAPGEEIENEDFACRASGFGRVLCGVVNTFLRDAIRDRVRQEFGRAMAPLRTALTEADPQCPVGTYSDGSRCSYADHTPVPLLLGFDGNLALNGTGSMYVLAAGDPYRGISVNASGATLGAFAGIIGAGHSGCVPSTAAPTLPAVPEWTAFRQNRPPSGAGTADVAIGVSEDYLNLVLWTLWDQGAFCRERDTLGGDPLASALSTAVNANAVLRAALASDAAASGVAVHLDRAPRVVVGRGDEPTLRIEAQQLRLDFGAASLTTDVVLPLSVTVSGSEIRVSAGTPRCETPPCTGPWPSRQARSQPCRARSPSRWVPFSRVTPGRSCHHRCRRSCCQGRALERSSCRRCPVGSKAARTARRDTSPCGRPCSISRRGE